VEFESATLTALFLNGPTYSHRSSERDDINSNRLAGFKAFFPVGADFESVFRALWNSIGSYLVLKAAITGYRQMFKTSFSETAGSGSGAFFKLTPARRIALELR